MQQLVPLELLSSGEVGRIAGFDGCQTLTGRLQEMGLRMGAEVRMVRSGSPCILALDNHRISFRAEEFAEVLVEVSTPLPVVKAV